MANQTVALADAILKQIYTPAMFQSLVFQNNPLLSILPKFEKFYGRNLPIPVEYATPMGVSYDFSTAQAQAVGAKYEDFVLTRTHDFGVATWDGEFDEATQNDVGAFVQGRRREIEGVLRTVSRRLNIHLYRNQTGAIGSCGSISTTTLTLANPEDACNFVVGMEVVCAADASSALRTGSATITGVDRSAGTLTSDSNWAAQINAATGPVAGDLIFQKGDYASASDKNMVAGLEAWVPDSAPGATAFFGVARNTDADRLGGIRYDGSSLSIEEALVRAQSETARVGEGAPDVCMINNKRYGELLSELGSKKEYTVVPARGMNGKEIATIGFSGVQLLGDYGPIKVVPDNACQHDTAWLLQLDTWMFCSIGPAPKLLMSDGNRFLRQSSSDGYEARVGWYGNLACKAPGKNCNVTLPT